MRRFAWKHPAFDYRFDAVVYCVFSALGFAALENILYVAQFGLSVAVPRALLSVPGHFFFAVYMGIYLGEAKRAEREGEGFLRDRFLRESILVPVLLHGFDAQPSLGILYTFLSMFQGQRQKPKENAVFDAFPPASKRPPSAWPISIYRRCLSNQPVINHVLRRCGCHPSLQHHLQKLLH